jgi:hypothetical protein
MDLKELAKPFPSQDIEWRIQRSGIKGQGPWGMCLAYVTARAIQDRLDEVCGPENWKNEFTAGPHGGVLCGISIRVDSGEWVTKWNGADNTDIEAVKGGLSSAAKRAGVEWGIGRYLYKLDTGWAQFESNGIYSAKIEGQYYKWNPPELPSWALPNSLEKDYAEQKEKVIAANRDRDDLEYDYHKEREAMNNSKDMTELKGHFGKFFKENHGNIEVQQELTRVYNAKKEELTQQLEIF